MLEASEGLPLSILFVVPSCVPATEFDETGGKLTADDISTLYAHKRILGLGEMMNYQGVVNGDRDVMEKIRVTKRAGKLINGHAPLLSGHALDRYISAGIFDDHECSSPEEAMERLRKGQWIMIRQGTAAKNLQALMPLFREPYSRRCLLVTDDKHPADLLQHGHIDSIIRQAVAMGGSAITGIRMATLQAAQRFGLPELGAVAPGYIADLLVLNDLETMSVEDVYRKGKRIVHHGKVMPFAAPEVRSDIWKTVRNSFLLKKLQPDDFTIAPKGQMCRVIRVLPGQLITKEAVMRIDFTRNNGVDTERDIVKLAVFERHMDTGHIGLGWISGLGLKSGAIASSVSHDSHNLIVAGTSCEDMATAANCVRKMGGGLTVAQNGQILAKMPLPLAGPMGLQSAETMADLNQTVRSAAASLGVAAGIEPFMNLAFVSLPVIPDIKMTTLGLVDVNHWKCVPLFTDPSTDQPAFADAAQ